MRLPACMRRADLRGEQQELERRAEAANEAGKEGMLPECWPLRMCACMHFEWSPGSGDDIDGACMHACVHGSVLTLRAAAAEAPGPRKCWRMTMVRTWCKKLHGLQGWDAWRQPHSVQPVLGP